MFLTLDATRKVQAGLGKGTADLIGFIEHEVTEADVGRKIAIFAAFEVKTAKGRASTEQEAFLAAVVRRGGVAGIVRSPADAESLVLEKWDSKLLHKKD